MNILFYSPFDQRSRDTESLMMAFHEQGHRVISLSQAEGRQIHPFLESHGIVTRSYLPGGKKNTRYLLKHLFFLVRFCRKEKIEVVYSHLESANFVASIAQYFISAKVYLCRHHVDEAYLYGFNNSLFYKLTYRLAKKIIVVSRRAATFMIEHEKVPKKNILQINLAYDFNLYPKPSADNATRVRNENPADLLLITVSRFTKFKRVDLSLQTLEALVATGLDCRLILLGRGGEEGALKKLAAEKGLADRVKFEGYVPNVMDYLAAADFLVHPSVLESSCVVVKEAALCSLPVIVCRGVGDFDDYIVDNENAFFVEQDNFVPTASQRIAEHHQNKPFLQSLSRNLYAKTLELFSIDNIISKYKLLNEQE